MKAVDIDPTETYSHLKGLKVADAYPHGPQAVDLVLGMAYEKCIGTGRRRIGQNGPDAVETI